MKSKYSTIRNGLFFLPLAVLSACNFFFPGTDHRSRIIHAEVVALDQPLTYNRFGSFNPYGMIYALKRDLVDTETCNNEGNECRAMSEQTRPGHVRLRDGKRPRPLVLRVNEGDELVVKFYNMLMPSQPDASSSETASRLPRATQPSIQRLDLHYTDVGAPEQEPVTLPGEGAEFVAPIIGEAGNPALAGADATRHYCGWTNTEPEQARSLDWPRSRCASITISGVAALVSGDPQLADLETGLVPIAPGQNTVYRWKFPALGPNGDPSGRKNTHLFFSHGAPAGGQGDGGSLVHGLFGVVNVEPVGSRWYRSQVNHAVWQQAWKKDGGRNVLDYEAQLENGLPALNLLMRRSEGGYELVYGDLNALIVETAAQENTSGPNPRGDAAFREFTVVFHDELKTFYADEFRELGNEFSLAGVGDGFAINYGSSGMGSILLANRKGIGPAKDCVECAYEEFFLESWANGDPALLPEYADDPANVHHAYLNDRVIFRNLHAGPKETHVFHLHAHQWLAQDSDTGTYLDSQTIAPQQGFSYEIYYGGGGNRNATVGDSIFHCHLYPHFAQGMWELWRVHDVLEDGSRRLPDAELHGADGASGTDPLTGAIPPLVGENGQPVIDSATGEARPSGTPIPAIIPLPGQAMPPQPSYLNDGIAAEIDGFPGYPFYIAGSAGHRTPQAPYDIHNDAGLGRHLIQCPKDAAGNSSCARTISGITASQQQGMSPDQIIAQALRSADFSVVMEKAQVKLLPLEGTPLEQIAMNFHSQGSVSAKTPEGNVAMLRVNDSPPKPGAPYADPCRGQIFDEAAFGNRTRQYHVSAIQTDLIVNRAGWHDPQARINVLDEDVSQFENKSTEKASPFFFRANSGDCIEFFHTNRTHEYMALDDFQVKTPTDTIGQHIHLVKFDVTASDGSGNGFNYEDGTFARGAILERMEAADHKALDLAGNTITLRSPAEDEYQTTVQRWYADPLLANTGRCNELVAEGAPGWRDDPACKDRTIRTVFTHDHFAPSSIQQHGFYAALLVEPRNARMMYPDGSNMDEANEWTGCKPGEQDDVKKSCAVGTQAMIVIDDDGSTGSGSSYREFALAVADFALLYDGSNKSPRGLKGFDLLPAAKKTALASLHGRLKQVQQREGHPVDPPLLPEAISKAHHNPYLVNYRHEPMPLRIGCADYQDHPERCAAESIRQQLPDERGDMAFVFSSHKHRDPGTEIFAGYEGEKVQLRVIQGAQEVQHILNIHGHHWPREIANPESPLVAAQEIGISEHFEMKLGLDNVTRGDPFVDYLYDFGSLDDLWNGAWGFIRSFDSYLDCSEYADQADREKCEVALQRLGCTGKRLDQCLKPLPGIARNDSGAVEIANVDEFMVGGDNVCPKDLNGGRRVTFYVDTVDLGDWLGRETAYDSRLHDPDSLAFILLDRQVATGADDPFAASRLPQIEQIKANLKTDFLDNGGPEPLVLRVNAGDCIKLVLYNHLPQVMGDAGGDAAMPRIVPLNTDPTNAPGAPAAGDVTPSNRVGLHPQLLQYNVAQGDGAAIGYNPEQGLVSPRPGFHPFVESYWYAGVVDLDNGRLVARARELGPVNLVSYGDVINHPNHGLFGALVVEPKGSVYLDSESREELTRGDGVRAEIRYSENGNEASFKEFVVFYRDGMNLHYRNDDGEYIPVPDCPVCDDSYDLGEKGINYRTAPFWVRLDQEPQQGPTDPAEGGTGTRWRLPDLNGAFFPTQFFTEKEKPVPTPRFVARAGDQVRFRVLQPTGRARQRTFLVYGHDFPDLLPYFGSPHAPLISVGKAVTATIDSASVGHWLYRDGPTQLWSGGAWGVFDVLPKDTD